jgi:mRNA interferase RelE/StbE
MAYRIIITRSAKRDIATLDTVVQRRLGKKLLHFAALDSLLGVAKQLEGEHIGQYRLRVGDYRLLFDLDGKDIIILHVSHRKDVYRKQ